MDKQQQDHASTERDLLARWVKWTQEFWSIRPEGVELVEQTRFLLSRPPQPPSASDERGRFEALYPMPPGCVRLSTGYAGSSYKAWETHHYMGKWEGWQARAALAPSPGVDAAEQWKDFAQHLGCCRTCAEDSVGSCIEGEKLKAAAYAAPSPAASADEWMAEHERLVDAAMQAAAEEEALVSKNAPAARAALLAHLKARP